MAGMRNKAHKERKMRCNRESLESITEINSVEMTIAQKVVDTVNAEVNNQLKDLNMYNIKMSEPIHLEGSVADGSKVLKPDEFDYGILVDMSENAWSKVPIKLSRIETKYLIDGSETKFFWNFKRKVQKKLGRGRIQKARGRKRQRNVKKMTASDLAVSDEQCEDLSWMFTPLHFFMAFHECISYLLRLRDDNFQVTEVLRQFPAVRVKVGLSYNDFNFTTCGSPSSSSADLSRVHSSSISIDYVPILRVGKECFVVKNVPYLWREIEHDDQHRYVRQWYYWRESFSSNELTLMRKLRTEAEPLFNLYKCIKAASSYINDKGHLRENCAPCDWLVSSGVDLLYLKQLDVWSTLRTGAEKKVNIYLLKTVLLHLYNRPDQWRDADVASLTRMYFELMDKFCKDKCFPNYFNGKNMLIR